MTQNAAALDLLNVHRQTGQTIYNILRVAVSANEPVRTQGNIQNTGENYRTVSFTTIYTVSSQKIISHVKSTIKGRR